MSHITIGTIGVCFEVLNRMARTPRDLRADKLAREGTAEGETWPGP